MSSTPKPLPLVEPADRRRGNATLRLNPTITALLRSWKLIAATTFAALVISAAFAKFALTKLYRAEAVLRPISQLMPNGIGASPAESLGSSLLGSTLGQSRAQEIVAILKSFDFDLALVGGHNLQDELFSEVSGWRRGSDPRWDVLRLLQRRFYCDYSVSTGNISISYLNPSRTKAERILGYYIDDLRQKLRQEQIRATGAAVKSLQEEAKSTPDSLLEAQLYQLVAQELQEQKLAMVDADFAFKVIENPAASDRPYSPNILLVTGLAGIVSLVLCCLIVVSLDWLRRARIASEGAYPAGRRRELTVTR